MAAQRAKGAIQKAGASGAVARSKGGVQTYNASAGGTFKAHWAANSNIFIGAFTR